MRHKRPRWTVDIFRTSNMYQRAAYYFDRKWWSPTEFAPITNVLQWPSCCQ